MKILLSGSTGFVGGAALPFLRSCGYEVVRLVRTKSALAADSIFWDPLTGEIDKEQFEDFDAVIHLAGANIASGRWTQQRKEQFMQSRCRDTWLLSQVLCRLYRPPKTLLCASAVGYYGDRGEEELTEASCKGEGFLSDLCALWEEATRSIADRGTRVVSMRFGIVLSPQGGILARMATLFRWGLGARIGTGKQFLSWIALEDLLRAIDYLLQMQLAGAINLTAPYPVTQVDFAQTLATHLHRPLLLSLPPFLVRLLFGEMGQELLLSSTRAIPQRLVSTGFSFKYPFLDNALLCGTRHV